MLPPSMQRPSMLLPSMLLPSLVVPSLSSPFPLACAPLLLLPTPFDPYPTEVKCDHSVFNRSQVTQLSASLQVAEGAVSVACRLVKSGKRRGCITLVTLAPTHVLGPGKTVFVTGRSLTTLVYL